MINKELISKIRDLGFEVTPDFRGELKVFSDEIPTEEMIKNIFPLLTIDEEIFFYAPDEYIDDPDLGRLVWSWLR